MGRRCRSEWEARERKLVVQRGNPTREKETKDKDYLLIGMSLLIWTSLSLHWWPWQQLFQGINEEAT